MAEKDNAHKGHRQRLKNRFAQYGLDSFSDLNALELLLFYALPRQDTNPLAHALLDRFGSLEAVLEASREELESVSGIGDNAVQLLQLIPALSRRYLIRKAAQHAPVTNPEEAGEYLLPYFAYAREELVYALYQDSRSCILACEQVNRGVVNAAEIGVRTLISRALELKCSYVILAHNHPSGVLLPSTEDEAATLRLRQLLNTVGITLSDHLIIAGDSFLSMSEVGIL